MVDRRLRRSDEVVFDMAGPRAVLLDASGTELITLNPVGSLVWNELDGRRDADELGPVLHERFAGVELTSCGRCRRVPGRAGQARPRRRCCGLSRSARSSRRQPGSSGC